MSPAWWTPWLKGTTRRKRVGHDPAHLALEQLENRALPSLTLNSFSAGLTAAAGLGQIVAGPDNNLWFTETAANKIGTITPTGTITEFAVPTPSSGVQAITAGAQGDLWFTEPLANKIGRILPGSGLVTEFAIPTANSSPQGIALRKADGSLWFTEQGANKIGRITTAGAITEFPITTAASGPLGIAGGPDNNMWFTESAANKIGQITSIGVVTEFATAAGAQPASITAGPDNNLWFIEQGLNKIGRITLAGTVTDFTIPTTSADPQAITSGPDGNLWFTELNQGSDMRNRIARISPAGVVVEFPLPAAAGNANRQPKGIALGSNGNMWFTEAGTNQITEDVLPHFLIVGGDAGLSPQIKIYDVYTTTLRASSPFNLGYPSGFTGGIRVALGDVTGTGVPDVVAGPGPGGGPDIRIADADGHLLDEFFAFDPNFRGGVYVATGYFDGTNKADIVVAADAGGGPDVRIFRADGTLLTEFFAFAAGFGGGVRVAVGDVNGDGQDDLIAAAGPSGGPEVKVFNGAALRNGQLQLLQDFYAYDPAFPGGVFVAAGDTNNDGFADVVTGAGQGGGPHVKVFAGQASPTPTPQVLQSFFAYDPRFAGGVRVGAVDVDNDGKADILTAPGPSGGPQVFALDGQNLTVLDDFFAFDPTGNRTGIFVGGR